MAKTMAKRINFNNMNTEIDKSDSPENATCIQTSNKETNDINGEFMYIGEDMLDESFDF
jgi:hypothetical protein